MLARKLQPPIGALPPQTRTEAAVDQRRADGRGPLDHWDMFANVMATRNALPPDHPSHLSLRQVTKAVAQEVTQATDGLLPMPDKVRVRDEGGHASTGGGYNAAKDRTKSVKLTMKRPYGQAALDAVTAGEDTRPFRKLVRTVAHEMTHVGQRRDPDVMRATTSAQREMQAYGGEMLSHPMLPALQGPQVTSAAKKFRKQAREEKTHRPNGKLPPIEKDLRRRVIAQAKTGRGIGL